MQFGATQQSSGDATTVVTDEPKPRATLIWAMAVVCTAGIVALRLGFDRGSHSVAADAAAGAVLVLVWSAAWLIVREWRRDSERLRRRAIGGAAVAAPPLPGTGLADAILAGSLDCIMELGLAGDVRSVNPAGLAFLDIEDIGRCRGLPVEDLCSAGVRDAVRKLVAGAGAGRLGHLVAPCPTATGNSRWWELTISPVLGADGHPASLIGIGRDVTARWAAEQAREEAIEAARLANRAKSEFLATMSHEIRTPLNGVLGAASFLLATEGLTNEQRRMLSLQLNAGRTLLAVINDILDWTKIEEGRVEIEHVPLSLRDLVDGCMDLLRETAAMKPIALHAEIAPDVPLYVLGDPTRLSQVLLNLLGNAVKFTKQGTITVSLSVAETRLRFAVRDPGIGIAKEKQSRLFQRFSQTDASTTREFGGSGLGLAICKSLVELMGGEIGVVSESGLGSLFWFELSLPEIEAPRALAEDHHPSAPAEARNLRILMADDVRFNQTIVSAMLEAQGHTVVVVENGAEAVEAAGGGGFDLILMDVQMPVMNGYAAARAIRALGDGVGGVPILALTAAAYREDEERALSAGMNGHLPKPIDNRTLLAAVRRWTEAGAPDERLATDTPVLDETTFEDLARLLGRDRVASLASLLDLQLTRILAEVIPSGDPVRLAREAHMLVSSAGSFGLVEVTRYAAAILKAGPTPAALHIGTDLQRAVSSALLALRNRVDSLRQAKDAPSVPPEWSDGAPPRQPCVLMAEDETLVMLNAIDFLEEEGFVIKTAATGEEALRLIELGESFDVLFADVRLPGRLDGLALARRARELRPDLPILMTSGHITTIDGIDLPGARFLPKPYGLAQVSAEMRALARHDPRLVATSHAPTFAMDKTRLSPQALIRSERLIRTVVEGVPATDNKTLLS